MTTMLERAARAVEEEGPVGCCSIDEDHALRIARAVLMAVREINPEDQMGVFVFHAHDEEDSFISMIDAILNEASK